MREKGCRIASAETVMRWRPVRVDFSDIVLEGERVVGGFDDCCCCCCVDIFLFSVGALAFFFGIRVWSLGRW